MTNYPNESSEIPSDFDELMRGDSAYDESDEQSEDTVLRCNRCNTPLTPKNAVLTPIGYRCKDCLRVQQRVFDRSKPFDPVIAFFISALIAFGGSWLVGSLGYIIILVATGLGLLIHNAVRLALRRRRGKRVSIAILFGAILGASPLLIRQIIYITRPKMLFVDGGIGGLVWYILYVGLVAASAYAHSTGARN